MFKIITKYLLFIFFCNVSIYLFSQTKIEVNLDEFKKGEEGFNDAKKNIKQGFKYYSKGNKGGYLSALDYLIPAYRYNSENAELNYQIGVCYLVSVHKSKSLPYLTKAFKLKNNITFDIHWLLGMSFQYNYIFEEALKEFILFENSLSPTELTKYKKNIDQKKSECKNAIKLQKNEERVFIDNIKTINSKYPDYCPLISADESMMIFTSRRENSTGNEIDENDGQFFEDIYISYNLGNEWSEAQNIGSPLNTNEHDATVGLSPNGQELLTYRDGDIYISTLKGEKWSVSKLLPNEINTEENENSACFSPDGKRIYFIRGKTPDTETSNGDIYFSQKAPDGKWGKASLLSNFVNTPTDEDGVFMHPDGKTLYFSSKGHNTMGGYDIFFTTLRDNGTWSKPENLGYPINTPDDDIYFVISANGRHGYYATVRDDGLGFTDIYMITFLGKEKPSIRNNEDNLIASLANPISENNIEKAVELKTIRLTVLKGSILDSMSKGPVEATIEIFDNEKNEIISTSTSNSKTGKYLVTLPSGKNYGMSVKADNFLFYSENFNIPASQNYQEIEKNISLINISVGAKVILKNIFFDVNKAVLRQESYAELFRLNKILTDYPNIKVEISGHTDNQGSKDHNQQLSEARAKAVVDFLISTGISSDRLTYRGASFTEPVASNDKEDGRQQNRRVEFKVISK